MEGALTAVVGIGGAILGASLTWAFSYLSELQKAIIQKEHTKFNSFHEREVELLTHVFTQLSVISRYVDRMIIELPTETSPSYPPWIDHYADKTFETSKNLSKVYTELRTYIEDNSIFISQGLETDIVRIVNAIRVFIHSNHKYTSADNNQFDERMEKELDSLNKEIRQLSSEIKETKSKIRRTVKRIVGNN